MMMKLIKKWLERRTQLSVSQNFRTVYL